MMFTGIVTDVGTIKRVEKKSGIVKFEITSAFSAEKIDIGASIMHSGVCLTVVEKQSEENNSGSLYSVQAVPETLNASTLKYWDVDTQINLEQSLKVGDEIGGHFVFGHVDGIGTVTSIKDEEGSKRVTIRPPYDLHKFIAQKGSVAIDGVSLTVASVLKNGDFEIAIIPHSWTHTTLKLLAVNSVVNIEVDMLARYIAQAIDYDISSLERKKLPND